MLRLPLKQLEAMAPGAGAAIHVQLHPDPPRGGDWNKLRDWMKRKGFGRHTDPFTNVTPDEILSHIDGVCP